MPHELSDEIAAQPDLFVAGGAHVDLGEDVLEAGDAGRSHRGIELDAATANEAGVFFQCCGNRLFVETYDLMQAKIAAHRTHLSVKPSHTDKSYVEHIELLDHLRKGDLDAALACLSVHIDRTRTTYSLPTTDISTE